MSGYSRDKKKKKGPEVIEPPSLTLAPHSFVFARGKVSKNTNQLALDLRQVMSPYTAAKLKVLKRNSIKDFVAISGKLHISHFMIISQTPKCQTLRIMRVPSGPTIYFTIHKFSLINDVLNSVKGSSMPSANVFSYQPLVALDNFPTEKSHHSITCTMLQNLFPKLEVASIHMTKVKRCVLFSYDPQTDMIEFRQYRVKIVRPDLSRSVRKIVGSTVPNISAFKDVSDYVLKTGGFSSGGSDAEAPTVTVPLSEGEAGDKKDADGEETEAPKPKNKRFKRPSQRKAVRMIEIGPRMTLQIYKIEAGLLNGEVLYHSSISKSAEERKSLVQLNKHRKSPHMFTERFNTDGTEIEPIKRKRPNKRTHELSASVNKKSSSKVKDAEKTPETGEPVKRKRVKSLAIANLLKKARKQ
jgi:ribosome biogenesis protein SSF1/2